MPSSDFASNIGHVTDREELGTAAPNRRERKTRETRRSILATARDLFDTHGYEQTTVEQIAAGADVAPRTFFRYFPTKESLLFADLDEARQDMLDQLEGRPTDEDPMRSLSIVLVGYAEQIVRRRDDVAWGMRICEEHGDGQALYERSMLKERTRVRVAEFIAQRLGVDAELDPRPLGWSIAVMGVFGSAMRSAADSTAPTPEEAVAAFDEMLLSTADALSRCAAQLRGD